MTTPKITFSSMEGLPQETLHSVFLEAFSDYEVPMNLPIGDFTAMHVRRGVSLKDSVGAFEGGRLVAFIFNGAGDWLGTRCAYDAGTGVIPSHRGLGLSKALAAETMERLRGQGFQNWLLEVLVNNDKAIKTYKGVGFKETRRLRCPEGTIGNAAEMALDACRKAGVSIVPAPAFRADRNAKFRDFEPSWQNSDDSVRRAGGLLVTREALDSSGNVLGYIVATPSGSIAGLAVIRSARRKGIGKALVLAMAAEVSSGAVRYVNVDADDVGTLALLSSLGIESKLDQWEMIRRL